MSNSFGKIFKITTFGESHGQIIGVVIDGCPSNVEITEDEINIELNKRKGFAKSFVSNREEIDRAKIVSGVYENKTTGAPICILIENTDVKPKNYDEIQNLLRPSHANFTYLQKYKIFDHRGASRASARETASRVCAAAVATKILQKENIQIFAYVKAIGDIEAKVDLKDLKNIDKSSIFCPDIEAEKKMLQRLKKVENEKDSIGGVVEFVILNMPVGLGDPVYEKLNAKLANALMSIPAARGFEIGDGFEAVKKTGSIRNDTYILKNGKIQTKTNNEGGIIAGISTGMPIIGRVAFKPTPTIAKTQKTLDIQGREKLLRFANDGRYDLCVAIRASVVVKAMCSLVLVDSYLLNFLQINNLSMKIDYLPKKKEFER